MLLRPNSDREDPVARPELFRLGAALSFALIVIASGQAAAQVARPAPVVKPMAAPASLPGETPLWPGAPTEAKGEVWSTVDGVPVVRNVTAPTLTPFLPAPDKATGAGVVIAPGGAFLLLAIDNEGWSLARWLQSRGIAAFVLKYRVRPTPPAPDAFAAELANLTPPPPGRGATGTPPGMRDSLRIATDDAQQAMRLVRSRAAEWNVDPDRVGSWVSPPAP